jgi:hypothetical protein
VRYLAGNPWKAVNDPRVFRRETSVSIDRALPAGLWERARQFMDCACEPVDARQWRIARALLLLMGASGLRREEAASAQRDRLRVSPHSTRLDPVALRAHWRDRGLLFDETLPSAPLVAPLIAPRFRWPKQGMAAKP